MTSDRPQLNSPLELPQVLAWLSEQGAQVIRGGAQTPPTTPRVVSGITMSSSAVRPGDVFVAPAGTRAHGAQFAAAAISAGAVIVLTDVVGAEMMSRQPPAHEIPVVVAERPRKLAGPLSALIYQDPASDLALIGVTGTQGKTTTTRLIEALAAECGVTAAVIGTVGTRIAGHDVASALTTPEAPELHAMFGVMREQRVSLCAMEVSSHALVMGRVDGLMYDVACFVNLGRDHLDFHADLEDYYQAKASLFSADRCRAALINVDDEHGRRLIGEVSERGDVPVTTYSVDDDSADWFASNVEPRGVGSGFTVHGPVGSAHTYVALPGEYNVSNAVCAIAAAVMASGRDLGELARGLTAVPGVPGRLEAIDEGQGFAALVDYAHKPDAIEAVLSTLRRHTTGRVIIVIGAGGDRDQGKRPIMAASAARLADIVVITDDNPRSESPAAIRAQMLAGIDQGAPAEVHEIEGRRAAIDAAVALARHGDALVVAGKGHETGQDIGGVIHDFDDRVELARALREGRQTEAPRAGGPR